VKHFEYRLKLDFPKDVHAPNDDILTPYAKSEIESLAKAFFQAERPIVRLVKSDGESSSAFVL
jgi:hypothetical protein